MAFKSQNMSVIAYANGYTMWCYSDSSGSLLDLMQNMSVFKSLMNTGDSIIINTADFCGLVIAKYNEQKEEYELKAPDSFEEYTKKLAEMAQQ